MKRTAALMTGLVSGAALVTLGSGALASQAAAAPATGQVSIVQAVPGEKVRVTVAGTLMNKAAKVGTVMGPVNLPVGRQKLVFSSGNNTLSTFVDVAGGSHSDVVLHLPAQRAGAPLINTYSVPLMPIGADKSRVLVAHTATVGAVDVTADGKTLFHDVANGQFAKADVPAGTYDVGLKLLSDDKSIARFQVPLKASTLNMVFAYAQGGEMKTIVDTRSLSDDGMSAPRRIHTGSAGLAVGAVSDFGLAGDSTGSTVGASLGGLAIVLALGLLVLRVRRLTTPAAAVSRRTR